jgi:hypothetical protein
MAGLVPAIHVFQVPDKTRLPACAGMTSEGGRPPFPLRALSC